MYMEHVCFMPVVVTVCVSVGIFVVLKYVVCLCKGLW